MPNDRFPSERQQQGSYGVSSNDRHATEGQDTGERQGFRSVERGRGTGRGRQSFEDTFDRQGDESGDGGYRHGSRSLGQGEGLRSRSMDPGQSSYGGFRGEDPYYQRQDFGGGAGSRSRGGPPWGDQQGGGQSAGGRQGGSGQWGGGQGGYGAGVDGAFVGDPSESWGGGRASGSPYGRRGSWEARPGEPQLTRRIDPKGYTRSDERIREMVCEQLSYSGLDVRDVSVNVSEGRVTLEGTVPERRTKHAIEDCVEDCAGVNDVENRVRVGARPATESD